MGTISLVIEGSVLGKVDAGGGLVLKKSASDVDVGRMIAALGHAYAIPVDGPAAVSAIMQRWFDNVCADAIAMVLRQEQTVASQTAANSIRPIAVENA